MLNGEARQVREGACRVFWRIDCRYRELSFANGDELRLDVVETFGVGRFTNSKYGARSGPVDIGAGFWTE